MGLLFWQRDRPAERPSGTDLPELVTRAKDGDVEARNRLIAKFQPFVLGIASRISGRFVQAGRDDEVSVGLLAFNEAIDSYDPAKGVSFLGFAEIVIRRRLSRRAAATARAGFSRRRRTASPFARSPHKILICHEPM
ncbi:MAG: hypothetical protein M1602_01435 [Firmicutes bacterium]|nr:hypothetical protein [Bacillota bacterium]